MKIITFATSEIIVRNMFSFCAIQKCQWTLGKFRDSNKGFYSTLSEYIFLASLRVRVNCKIGLQFAHNHVLMCFYAKISTSRDCHI